MINSLFFSLLRIAVCREDTLSHVPDGDEWRAVFAEAKRHTLVGISYLAIERLPSSQRPPRDVLLNWYRQTECIKTMNRRLNEEAVSITQYFTRAGLRSAVLKGQGVAQSYPDSLLRTPGDIDLWVEGERRHILHALAEHYKVSEIVYHHADVIVPEKAEVEVHFRPSWSFNYFRNRRWQTFFHQQADAQFAHKAQLPENAGEIAIPTTSFNAVYLLMHIYRHLFEEGIGLRQLLDYYYCLHQSYTLEEQMQIRQNWSDLGLLKFAAAVMYVEQEVFGLEDCFLLTQPHEKEGRFLLSEIMTAGNFGQYDQRNRPRPNEGAFGKFCRRVKRNIRFVRHYPGEALWSAPFKIWHYAWRKYHGYL